MFATEPPSLPKSQASETVYPVALGMQKRPLRQVNVATSGGHLLTFASVSRSTERQMLSDAHTVVLPWPV